MTAVRTWLFALVVLLALFPARAADEGPALQPYEQILVETGPDLPPAEILLHPDLEFMGWEDGAVRLLSRPEITAELRARGYRVEVEIPDLASFYAARSGGERDYGIWHTYAETVDEMQAIHAEYPQITTTPEVIGHAQSGRSIWAMKVSDNPTIQENEPEVLFDGAHHAREIMAVEVPLHFIRYLCENYGSDPVVTHIVDERQVWFVPIVNVDGFVYNESTNPYGGGMWRKNRRDNGLPGCEGVDPNRNYPYQWGGQGSSNDPCSETYRGPSAGSEPEIQAQMALINDHDFVAWQSYHSVVGMILFPWGYTTALPADFGTFMALTTAMTRDSHYTCGTISNTLYVVSGGSCDWGYGATSEHEKIFAVTTEVGGTGFWPDPSERDGLIAENLYSNIYLCLAAGAYPEIAGVDVTGGDGNGRLDPGETAAFAIAVTNIGLRYGLENARLLLACDDPYLVLQTGWVDAGTIAAGQTAAVGPIGVSAGANCPEGREVDLRVRLEAGGLIIDRTVQILVGQRALLYGCDFELEAHGWIRDPSWTALLGEYVRIDPIPTPYQPGDDTTPAPGVHGWITLQNPGGSPGYDVDQGIAATRSPLIDLSAAATARLDLNYFFGQNELGDDPGDFFRIDLSNDGGTSFPVNLVLIGDVNHAPDWHNLQVDLESHLTLTDQMLIRVQTADGVASGDIIEGGIDDVFVYYGGTDNEPPSEPALLWPPAGAGDVALSPELLIDPAVDPEGDPLVYGFRVYSDPELTQLVAAVDGLPEGPGGRTAWTVTPPLMPEQTYHWRAYAADPSLYGLYAPAASFTTTVGSSSAGEMRGADIVRLTAGPSPAHGALRIRYSTPAVASSRIDIVDLSGRRVRSLPGERWTAGWQEIAWDGRDEAGQPAGGGQYWVRLVLPGETRTVRVVLLK